MPNHPPAPVVETIVVPIHTDADCDAIKAEFDIETRTHRKGAASGTGMESHHVLQDKAMTGLISKYSGHAVLLAGAVGGEHDIINNSQIARNCPPGSGGGAGPSTFGQLQTAARDDLAKGLQGRRVSNKTGKPMSKAQAEKLADCLVAEAVRKTNEKREDKGEEPLNADSAVSPVQGCITPDTLVWTADTTPVAAHRLSEGMLVRGAGGLRAILGVEECYGETIEICLESDSVVLASSHRARLDIGAYVRADKLQVGDVLATLYGGRRIRDLRRSCAPTRLRRFLLSAKDECYVGSTGIEIEAERAAVPVVAHCTVHDFCDEG
jgi:hypothetical protein